MSGSEPLREPGALRSRLRAGGPLLGTFVKTPSIHVIEVLALAPLDVVCLDQEHAPFGHVELDACVAVARALGLPTLVRVPGTAPEHIGRALDLGATGVLVPHVDTPEQARAAVAAARFAPDGTRGYAGSHRAAHYATRSITANLDAAAAEVTVVVQIESPEAVAAVDAIAAVEGVDALFIGPVDLAVSMGANRTDDPAVLAAVASVIDAGRRAGVPVGAFAGSPHAMQDLAASGATLLLAGSDHAAILDGMRRMRADLDGADRGGGSA